MAIKGQAVRSSSTASASSLEQGCFTFLVSVTKSSCNTCVLTRSRSSSINSLISRCATRFFGELLLSNAYTSTLVSTKLGTLSTVIQIATAPLPVSGVDKTCLERLSQPRPSQSPPAGLLHQPCQVLPHQMIHTSPLIQCHFPCRQEQILPDDQSHILSGFVH